MSKEIYDLPETKPRESRFTLDEIIYKISGIDHGQVIRREGVVVIDDKVEALLCLANEIKKLKDQNSFLRKKLEKLEAKIEKL